MTTRSRLAALGLLIAAFVLGAIVGGVGVSAAEHRGIGGPKHSHGRDGFLARLKDQLELNDTQVDSIRGILDRHRPTMDSMWQEVRPRFDSARTVMRSEIRAQMTPEQQQRYQELLERRERESRERRNR